MPITAVIGAQFGDEAKGKITDFLAGGASWVVRFQGGPNAGHSIVVDGKRIVLHQISSGILHAGCSAVSGPGMVISPLDMAEEIRRLREDDMMKGTLHISERAHVILPWHRIEDAWEEETRGGTPTGTTLRGMGPAYEDRTGRWGIRIGELARPEIVKQRLERLYRTKSHMAGGSRELPPIDAVADELGLAWEALSPYVHPTEPLIWKALDKGEHVIFEGAQGTLLDIDFGTYPYTTSSHTTAAGAFAGVGIAPREMDEVIGVTKAYATRVGNGAFPTELKDAFGDRIREKGGEKGATTGRPRRCGWLDLVLLRYAAKLSGFTSLAVTKVDVLGGEEKIQVCVGYKAADGSRIHDYPPVIAEDFEKVEPIYESLPAWDEFTPAIHERIREEGWLALPKELVNFLTFLGKSTGVPVRLVSYGPSREQTVDYPPVLPAKKALPQWNDPGWQ